MVIARTINIEKKYVLLCDRELPKQDQTVFYYKLPTLDQQYASMGNEAEYIKSSNGDVKTVMKIDKSGEIETLVSCIVKVEGLNDEAGNKVTWPADAEGRKKVLSQLDGPHRFELAEAIRTGTPFTENEIKNYAPQSK